MDNNGHDQAITATDPMAGVAAASGELAPTAAAARSMAEIQAAVVLARQYPRNDNQARQDLIRACRRPTFALEARYSFRRGGKTIEGPTVKMAREAARAWGNFRSGFYVAAEDADTGTRTVIGWAWDLQTNYYREESIRFKWLVQRKQDGGETAWVAPDERDGRELTGRQGAVAERNAILRVLPSDYVGDASAKARQTLADRAAEDPDKELKAILDAFDTINVTAAQLERFVGHNLNICSPSELVDLRDAYQAIANGTATAAEIFGDTNGDPLAKAATDGLDGIEADLAGDNDGGDTDGDDAGPGPSGQPGPDEGGGVGASAGAQDVPAEPPPSSLPDEPPSALLPEELADLERDQLLGIIDERAKGLGMKPAAVRKNLATRYEVRNIAGVDDAALRWVIGNWSTLVEDWQREATEAAGAEPETNGSLPGVGDA